MILCLCRNITEKEAIETVKGNNVTCISGFNRCFSCPVQCGACKPYIKEVIDNEQ